MECELAQQIKLQMQNSATLQNYELIRASHEYIAKTWSLLTTRSVKCNVVSTDRRTFLSGQVMQNP